LPVRLRLLLPQPNKPDETKINITIKNIFLIFSI
jgi:hypothetical protein